MLGKILEVVRYSSAGVYRQLKRPVTIPLLVVGMCGLTAFWRRFFQTMSGDDRRRPIEEDSEEEPLVKKRATRGSVAIAALEELAKYKTIEEFGYKFNENGEMVDIKTGGPFEFNVHKDRPYNQKRYELIGEQVTEHVYRLLETEAKLKRVNVPLDAKDGEPTSFIFVSDDYKTNTDKLLILIHGSGVVRAGQWARRLIMNNNLDCGTQLPFIARARKDGYAVIVLNTNLNNVEMDGRKIGITHNTRPEEHGKYVWENIIKGLPAKNIAIVAHSYGGMVTTQLAREFADEFVDRVFAIAFTDSVHSLAFLQAQESITQLYVNRARNWVASTDPLDTPVSNSGKDCPCVSAGHDTHEWTSWTSLSSIFKFFAEKLPGEKEEGEKKPEEKAMGKEEEL